MIQEALQRLKVQLGYKMFLPSFKGQHEVNLGRGYSIDPLGPATKLADELKERVAIQQQQLAVAEKALATVESQKSFKTATLLI